MASGDNQDVDEVVKRMKKVSVKAVIDHNGVKEGEMVIEEEVKDGVMHLNVNGNESESVKDGDRHCAFCLDLVSKDKVKTCSKCKRRAYCSKECQKADWKTGSKDAPVFNGKIYGYGQGHKNWCGLEYGEEDVDWKVVPVEGKGLGIVALRDLPPLYRIIVDGAQRFPQKPLFRVHPAFHDLAVATSDDPLDAATKWEENSVGTAHSAERTLGLRIARANHSCDPNSCVYPNDEYNVLILVSDKEIKAGEEVCWAYVPILDLDLYEVIKDSKTAPLMFARRILEKERGIICPPSCVCRGEKEVVYSSLIHTCLSLQKEGESRLKKPKKGRPALPKMEAIIEMYQSIGAPETAMSGIYSKAANYAMCDVMNGIASDKKQNLETAKSYGEKHYNIMSRVWHPKDADLVACQEPMKRLKLSLKEFEK